MGPGSMRFKLLTRAGEVINGMPRDKHFNGATSYGTAHHDPNGVRRRSPPEWRAPALPGARTTLAARLGVRLTHIAFGVTRTQFIRIRRETISISVMKDHCYSLCLPGSGARLHRMPNHCESNQPFRLAAPH
eukprot:3725061-Pleurochrysis_carterae.AAC.8